MPERVSGSLLSELKAKLPDGNPVLGAMNWTSFFAWAAEIASKLSTSHERFVESQATQSELLARHMANQEAATESLQRLAAAHDETMRYLRAREGVEPEPSGGNLAPLLESLAATNRELVAGMAALATAQRESAAALAVRHPPGDYTVAVTDRRNDRIQAVRITADKARH